MGLSASTATLNKCPGLNLLAWAQVKGSTLITGFNVASVALVGSAQRITFSNALANSNYVVDVVHQSGVTTGVANVGTGAVDVAFTDHYGGTAVTAPPAWYVAIYG